MKFINNILQEIQMSYTDTLKKFQSDQNELKSNLEKLNLETSNPIFILIDKQIKEYETKISLIKEHIQKQKKKEKREKKYGTSKLCGCDEKLEIWSKDKDGYSTSHRNCDICLESIKKSSVYYSCPRRKCHRCDFDICSDCISGWDGKMPSQFKYYLVRGLHHTKRRV